LRWTPRPRRRATAAVDVLWQREGEEKKRVLLLRRDS
jgi:hypothetical protein